MDTGPKVRRDWPIGLALLLLFLLVAMSAAYLPKDWLRSINAGFVPLIAAGLLGLWAIQRRRSEGVRRRQQLALSRIEQAIALARSIEADHRRRVQEADPENPDEGATPSSAGAPDPRTLH